MNCNDILLFYNYVRENIKYAAESKSLRYNHESKKDRTTYFNFLAEHNNLELNYMRNHSLH